MRIIWILTALLLGGILTVALFFPEVNRWWIAGMAAVTLILLVWLLISVLLPTRSALLGISLLKSGEYNNRLTRVGEPHADKIVGVFNSLMARLSEESLKVQEINHLLDLLIQASTTGVVLMDYDFNISFVNPAFLAMSGEEKENLVARKYKDLPGAVWQAAARMRVGDSESLSLEGNEIYKLTKLSFMEKGFRREFLLLDRLTDEIRQAEKQAYGKVVRTMAHEVNNTIGGVSSFLETLVEIEGEDSEIGQLAESCILGCQSLAEFIRRYAEVVKIGDPALRKVNLNDEILAAQPFLNTLIPSGIELVINCCEEDTEVNIDPVMMRQVLVNIVKNAAESVAETGRKDGKVEIRTIRNGKRVELEVEDNGKGISAEAESQLFKLFYTTRQNGQGIGLTMTAEILRRHGFPFTLTTPTPGRTLFRITL